MLVGFTRSSSDYKKAHECKCPADFRIKHGDYGKEVDAFELDHYARKCPTPPFSRMLAEVMYRQAINTFRYAGGTTVSVTMLTACPLHMWFERRHDYVEDPLASRWMLRGTFAHEGLLKHLRDPRYIIEQPMRLNLTDGNVLYGTLDVYDLEDRSIHDLKTQKWSAIDRKADTSAAKLLEEYWVKQNVFQVNAYRAMWKVATGMDTESLHLHYWDGDLREVELEAPVVDVDEMLAILDERARQVHVWLSTDDPTTIEPRDYSGLRWNPREGSPLWYKIKEVLSPGT